MTEIKSEHTKDLSTEELRALQDKIAKKCNAQKNKQSRYMFPAKWLMQLKICIVYINRILIGRSIYKKYRKERQIQKTDRKSQHFKNKTFLFLNHKEQTHY